MIRNFSFGIFFIMLLSGFTPFNWRHDHIGNSDGLSNSAVTSVFMDSKGYMWFGTWDGLNRFDGSKIKVFKPDIFQPGSINNNIIREIIEDKYENLWIVTENGINLYDFNNELFTPYLEGLNTISYRENSFHATLGPDSLIWCGVYNWGISSFDPKNKKFLDPIQLNKQLGLLKKNIGLTFSSDGLLWIIDENGTVSGLKKHAKWELVKQYKLSNKHEILPEKHWFLKFHEETWLFVAIKDGGLLALNIDNGNFKFINDNNGKDLNITTLSKGLDEGIFWGGTDDGKLFKMTISRDRIQMSFFEDQLTGLSNKRIKIWSITETKPDLLWIGTDGDGVHKYITKGNAFSSTKKGDLSKGDINHNIVRAIHEDSKGNILIGTRGNGLNFIPVRGAPTAVFDVKNGLSNNAVLSLGSDQHENIWIGVDGEGIDMLETSSGNIFHFPADFINKPNLEFGSVYAICIDKFNDIWLGTSGFGLIRLTVKKNKIGNYILADFEQFRSDPLKETGLQSDIIYAILEGRSNVLWIGSRGGGLHRLNTLTRKIEVFRSSPETLNSLNNNDVLSLWKSNDQELWIGTSGGLNRLNMSVTPYQFSYFTERKGLPNNTIHAVLGDLKGNIWVSTNKGLSKLNKKTGVIRNYFYSDGLQSNEYSDGASCLGQTSGLLYFGGVNGFDKFNPNKITDSDYFPRLAITEFSLFNQGKNANSNVLSKNVDLSDSLMLRYNQNFFKFRFTTLNYYNKQKCEYEYKLENFNQAYVFAGKDEEAIFTNVPSGEYILKLRCTNEDGIWNPDSRNIYISISPPFWETAWAYLLYALFLVTSLFLIIYLALRRVRIRNKLAIERIEVQKTKEMNKYKFQFFTNIAHEFRTPLTLIMVPAAQLLNLKGEDTRVATYIKAIYNNATRLLHLIQELIDFRKVETGNLNLKIREGSFSLLVATIIEAFLHYAQQNNINLKFVESNTEIRGWFDNKIIEKILLNLISNAIKFTPKNGSVVVRLSMVEHKAVLKIEDTGIGISDKDQEKIFTRFFHQANVLPIHEGTPEGAGVGLSLTKSLVELHRGSIHVESKLGEGSCFTVTVPISEKDYMFEEKRTNMLIDGARIKEKVAEKFIGLDPVSFDSIKNNISLKTDMDKTILVVDDNAQLRHLVTDLLGNDYTIQQATNGHEALQIINKTNIDVVVSDIIMPEMDGLELCRNLKENIATCHIPVILLTAKGDLEHRLEGIEVGADSYIPKPFDPRHLKIRIRKLLEARMLIIKALKIAPEKPIEKLKGLNIRDKEFLSKLQTFVEDNLDSSDLDAGIIASSLAMSKTQLYRKVKAITGFTPHGFIRHYRINKAARLLKETSITVAEVIYETGFNNRTYFYRSFKEVFGISPGNYAKNNS